MIECWRVNCGQFSPDMKWMAVRALRPVQIKCLLFVAS